MPTGICKFSQRDKKMFYWYVNQLKNLFAMYNIDAELTIYDVCDDNSSEEVHSSGKKMA